MKTFLQVDALNKLFGSNTVLHNISFEIQSGESVALVGPSGCGKSTLLNIIGLLETLDSGAISLEGRAYPSINSKKATLMRRTEINYLFQSFALINDWKVSKNLSLALQYTKLSKQEQEHLIKTALESYGIGEKFDAVVNELSGGEKQRVAIARAMIKPGNLILADEPTGSLDKAMATIVIDSLLDSVHANHKTLLMVTHDMSIAQRCDRIIELPRHQ
ncbi:putative bacteriocin ABC transporter [Atopobium sp. ICM42b]|uniref:ABC transporter ATP-binding protein n=1 Tax=Atopobium sp. ICM42b TaxID=1190620 RepID=UPI000451B958|nr:ATP-binding cassette domain-containing protein [Atopobium sp. ICM42b]EWC94158.1 putative bacteriocin ABC transporter [Atopobium sp. ICM42b]